MEIAGTAIRCMSSLPCYRLESKNRFHADQRQQLRITCGKKKWQMKLVKGLEKDLSLFASMRFGIDPKSGFTGDVQKSLFMEAAEVLMKQLECVRVADEDAKSQRKEEKKRHKTKSMQMREGINRKSMKDSNDVSSQNPTDFTSNRKDQVTKSSSAAEAVRQVMLQSMGDQIKEDNHQCDLTRPPSTQVPHPCTPKSPSQKPTSSKKVEICMGGKCRKSGSPQLMHQFQSLAAKEENINVVGCKCLGKCRSSSNVKLSSGIAAPTICSNVRVSDVDSLMADFLEDK